MEKHLPWPQAFAPLGLHTGQAAVRFRPSPARHAPEFVPRRDPRLHDARGGSRPARRHPRRARRGDPRHRPPPPGRGDPDPWPPELDAQVRQRDAVPVCTNCLFPQQEHLWFCPHCHFPTGEYVTVMPYLNIYAQGELLRRGVSGPPDPSVFRRLFHVLFSVQYYSVLAPLYWFWMWRKADGRPIASLNRPDLPREDEHDEGET